MKRFFLILALVAGLLSVFLIIDRKTDRSESPSVGTSVANFTEAAPEGGVPKPVSVPSIQGSENLSSPPQPIPPKEILNALAATNIGQWKVLIPGLRMLDRFEDKTFGSESWVMEETNRETGILILLQNGETKAAYVVRFVDVETYLENGNIRSVEMHSPIMNIDETRALGLQLCELLGMDSKEFIAWCDKVGNHWLDAPLYSSKSGYHLGFETLRTYDDDKPWYINFVIVNRER